MHEELELFIKQNGGYQWHCTVYTVTAYVIIVYILIVFVWNILHCLKNWTRGEGVGVSQMWAYEQTPRSLGLRLRPCPPPGSTCPPPPRIICPLKVKPVLFNPNINAFNLCMFYKHWNTRSPGSYPLIWA